MESFCVYLSSHIIWQSATMPNYDWQEPSKAWLSEARGMPWRRALLSLIRHQ
jgi:hypothetical protein